MTMRWCGCMLLIVTSLILHVQGKVGKKLKSESSCVDSSDLKTLVTIGNETFYLAAGVSRYSTWYEAQVECQDLGMQLVSLDTEERWNMISDWVLTNPGFDNWMWTSGHRPAMEEDFVWMTTGNTFSYTDWNIDEPSRSSFIEACVNFNAGTGGWDDDDCTEIELMFMCENLPILK